MNISNVKAAMNDFNDMLAELSTELDLKIVTKGSIKYSTTSFTVQVVATEKVNTVKAEVEDKPSTTSEQILTVDQFNYVQKDFYDNIAKSKYREHKLLEKFVGTRFMIQDDIEGMVVGLSSTRSNANVIVIQVGTSNKYAVKLSNFVK